MHHKSQTGSMHKKQQLNFHWLVNVRMVEHRITWW